MCVRISAIILRHAAVFVQKLGGIIDMTAAASSAVFGHVYTCPTFSHHTREQILQSSLLFDVRRRASYKLVLAEQMHHKCI